MFIPVDKLQLLHHPDVLQSSADANFLFEDFSSGTGRLCSNCSKCSLLGYT